MNLDGVGVASVDVTCYNFQELVNHLVEDELVVGNYLIVLVVVVVGGGDGADVLNS